MLGGRASARGARRRVARPTARSRRCRRRSSPRPYRPTGLSTAARAVVRLVDELSWLDAHRRRRRRPTGRARPSTRAACAVKVAAASVLERGADLLDAPQRAPDAAARRARRAPRRPRRAGAARDEKLPVRRRADGDGDHDHHLAGPELPRAGAELRRLADRRQRRPAPRPPSGAAGSISCSAASPQGCPARCRPRRSAPARTSSGTRCGCRTASAAPSGLGLAVLVADLAVPALLLGRARRAVGAALERAEHRAERSARPGSAPWSDSRRRGADRRSSAPTRPCSGCCCRRGPVRRVAPAAISFAAGQAAFTVTLLILFNLIAPEAGRSGSSGSRTSRSAAR